MAEYCLLTALLTLVAAAIFVQASGGIQAIWDSANTHLVSVNSATAPSGSTSTASSPGQK